MTARTPLYYTSGDIKQFTNAEIVQWQRRAIKEYADSKSVVITVDAGNGNIGTTMDDTRFKSSAATQNASSYQTPGSLGTVTTSFNSIVQTVTNPSVTGDTNNVLFPCYLDGSNNIVAMSEADFVDTFIKPAIVLMCASSEAVAGDYGGTYAIGTSTSLSNHTNVSSTAVFTDTSADISEFTTGNIGSAGSEQTHNEVVQAYYMHVRDGVAVTPDRTPLHADTSGNLNEYATATFAGYLQEYIKDLAASDDVASAHNIRYNINGSGETRGTSMLDKRFNGTTNLQVTAGADDYRKQNVPSGSLATVTTYNFKINRE